MEPQIPNRLARQGRPAATAPARVESPAMQVMTTDTVPPVNCPRCGRGQQPRMLRRRPGEIDCACALCGKPFTYRPPTIRATNDA
jgi:uncharacterized C2H2 Zn-finger protein